MNEDSASFLWFFFSNKVIFNQFRYFASSSTVKRKQMPITLLALTHPTLFTECVKQLLKYFWTRGGALVLSQNVLQAWYLVPKRGHRHVKFPVVLENETKPRPDYSNQSPEVPCLIWYIATDEAIIKLHC